jgi:hypothetical protein
MGKKKRSYKDRDDIDDYDEELSDNAKKYCAGLNLGLESYEDFAPVARKVTAYAGGPPSSTQAGDKNTPTGIPGLPSGWEWRKSADRSMRAGGQTRWERVEEWTGAQKVLTDKTNIYF